MYRTELKELTNDEWLEKYKYSKEKTSFDNWTYYNEYDGSYEYCWAWKYGENSGHILSYRHPNNPNGFEEFGGGID